MGTVHRRVEALSQGLLHRYAAVRRNRIDWANADQPRCPEFTGPLASTAGQGTFRNWGTTLTGARNQSVHGRRGFHIRIQSCTVQFDAGQTLCDAVDFHPKLRCYLRIRAIFADRPRREYPIRFGTRYRDSQAASTIGSNSCLSTKAVGRQYS